MTTTHPMIERLEDAAARAFLKNVSAPMEMHSPEDQAAVSRIVIAVLRALREPDEGMVAAMNATAFRADGCAPAFTAAIDSLLTEQKGTEV